MVAVNAALLRFDYHGCIYTKKNRFLKSVVIDKPLEEFECYRLKQLNPELYPY